MQNYWKYHVIILVSFLQKFLIFMFVLSVAKYVLFSPPSVPATSIFCLMPFSLPFLPTKKKKNVPCQKAYSTKTLQTLNIRALFPHFALDSEIYFRQMRFSFGNYFILGLWVFFLVLKMNCLSSFESHTHIDS